MQDRDPATNVVGTRCQDGGYAQVHFRNKVWVAALPAGGLGVLVDGGMIHVVIITSRYVNPKPQCDTQHCLKDASFRSAGISDHLSLELQRESFEAGNKFPHVGRSAT
jgi:hypothetical protein